VALKNHQHIKLESTPRMADFARWMVAAEPGLRWEPGDFMRAYTVNRASAVEMGIEASAVAQAIETMTETVPEWQGTATELLDQLDKVAPDKVLKTKEWPKTAQALSNRLRRLAPTMRSIGTEIDFDREGHARKRIIEIRKVKENSVLTVRNSGSGDSVNKTNDLDEDTKAVDGGRKRTQIDDGINPPSSSNYTENNKKDDADDADDDLQLFSNPG